MGLIKMDFYNIKSIAENLSLLLILGFMIYEKVKDRIKAKEYSSLTVFLKKNDQIQEKLTEIRVTLNADRVKLFQFHNGDHYIGGDSALKCSITHVSVKAGVSYPQNALSNYNNVVVSNIGQYTSAIIKDGMFFSNVDDLIDDDWKKVKILNGTKTVLMKRVGTDPNIKGFVIISWQDNISIPSQEHLELTEKTLDSLSIIIRSRKS